MVYAILSLLEYKVSRMEISGAEAFEILSTWYEVMLNDKEGGLKWDVVAGLSKKQLEIRNLVYKNG